MGKKRTAKPPKQLRIEGTYDEVPGVVAALADEYVEAKREKASWLATMNAKKEDLIAAMREHGVTEIDIDDGEKRLILVDQSVIKIEAKKQPEEAAA